MGKYIELTGMKFGEWTVVEKSENISKDKNIRWICKCSCGKTFEVNGNSLRSGRSTKCVHCVEPYSKTKYTNDPIKTVFKGMKQRCYYEKHNKYKNYGGKGIRIYQPWLDNPETFYQWAYENGYQKGASIERVDNNQSYVPNNCTFVAISQQQRNRNNTIQITIEGQTKILSEWCKIYGINRNTVKSRINRGMGYQEAVTTPSKEKT